LVASRLPFFFGNVVERWDLRFAISFGFFFLFCARACFLVLLLSPSFDGGLDVSVASSSGAIAFATMRFLW